MTAYHDPDCQLGCDDRCSCDAGCEDCAPALASFAADDNVRAILRAILDESEVPTELRFAARAVLNDRLP